MSSSSPQDTGTTRTAGGQVPRQYAPARPEPTGWVGWIVFAATLALVVGVFDVIEGIVALFKTGYYLVAPSGLVVNVNYTTWGWVHIAIGAVLIVTALGLFAGQTWARALGVVIAVLSAIVNFAFIPAFPLWCIAVIAIDVFIIYALTAHGAEMKEV
jgi:hypothetical protein